MRYLPYAIPVALVAALVLASPASAQRGPGGGEQYREMMRKHLAECEVCAALNKQIEELQAQLDDLERQKEALRLERLEAKINELATAHPALKEQLEALLAECKKAADLEKQVRENTDATRNLIDGLQLEPEDRAALNEAVGPLDQGPPPDRQFNRFVNQRQRLRRDRDPQAADRLAEMEAEHKRQLEALKQTDPKLYEITVKEEELTAKLDDLRADLTETMRQHLRNAQQ